nr:triple tyrosine motif-containing protein [Bacteroidales bacterium]
MKSINLLLPLLFFLNFTLKSEISLNNYRAIDYKAHSKNWDMTTDSTGRLFVANQDGLLVYNGAQWQLYQLPRKSVIRSVFIDSNGVLYTGSLEEFGFWTEDVYGKFHYKSLSQNISNFTFHNEEIWKILESDSSIYFHSFSSIFQYKKDHISRVKHTGMPAFIIKSGHRIFTHQKDGQLMEIRDDEALTINNQAIIKDAEIQTCAEHINGSTLMGTNKKGCYIMNKDSLSFWDTEISHLLKGKKINKIISNKIDRLFFATNGNGLFVSSLEGDLIKIINTDNGLLSNSIQELHLDHFNHLWLALNGGVAQINLSPYFESITSKKNRLGAVYSIASYNGMLYIGTNIGVAYYDSNKQANKNLSLDDFKLIPELEGHIWSLDVIDDQLLCGHSNGTFVIKNPHNIQQISNVEGAFCIKKITANNHDYLIQGTYIGLVIYQKSINQQWIYKTILSDFTEPINQIEIDYLGNIWTTHYAKKYISKLALTEDLMQVASVQNFLTNNTELVHDATLSKLGEQIIIFSDGQRFAYNYIKDTLELIEKKDLDFGEFNYADKICKLNNNKYAFITKNKLGVFQITTKSTRSIFSASIINKQLVDNSIGIYETGDKQLFICLENGFERINTQQLKTDIPQLFFRNIHVSSEKKHTIDLPLSTNNPIKLPNRNNNLSCTFSSNLISPSLLIYHYYLEGIDDDWHVSNAPKEVVYERLPYGKYNFRVKARDVYNRKVSEIEYTFEIKPPFYLTKLSFVFYLGLFIYLLFIIKHYNKKQIARERKKNQSKILGLENENLKNEIKYK